MKHLLLSLVLAAAVHCPTGAQYHNAGYFGVTWSSGGKAYALKSDMLGKVTTMQLGTVSHYACEVAGDNKLVLVSDSTSGSIWKIDPTIMSVTGTLFTDTALKTHANGLEYDHNGDLYVFTSSSLFRVDTTNRLTTVTTGSFTLGNATIDIDTAELLIATGLTNGSLLRINRHSGVITTLASGFNTRYGDSAQDVLTGDLYVPTCCGTSTNFHSLSVLRAGQAKSTIYINSQTYVGGYGVQPDRASAAKPRLVSGCFRSSLAAVSGGIWHVDIASASPSKVASFNTTTVADVSILEGRNIHGNRTAPAKYDINISFPAESSHPYVVGLGYTGVRPALPLPDSRRIPLILDDLTVLSIRNQLSPFATNTVGILDAFGKARVKIDLSSLYPAIRGLVLWMVVVTLDARAPLGLATISDPFVLKVD